MVTFRDFSSVATCYAPANGRDRPKAAVEKAGTAAESQAPLRRHRNQNNRSTIQSPYASMKIRLNVVLSFILLVTQTYAFAEDAPNNSSDTEIAAQLVDCYNGLTAVDGIAAAVDMKIDRERLLKSKRIAARGVLSLVDQAHAKELHSASKQMVKVNLTTALEEGSSGVAAFIERYTSACSKVTDQHGSYIAGQIAKYEARSNNVEK
jgi:hypothetical protein